MSERFLWFPDEEALQIRKLLEARFSERTAIGCQVRPGNKGKGYPNFTWKGRTHNAHRVAYAVWRGAVPVPWNVCHLCSNPQCVNPTHLALGTAGDNARDYSRKTKNKPRLPGHREKLSEEVRDPSGLSWPPPRPTWAPPAMSPLEAMAFPASVPKPDLPYCPPTKELLRMAFPASYKDED